MLLLRRLVYSLLALTLILAGLWLVVANDQSLSLNLLFLTTPASNAGLVVILSFAVGAVVGLLVGLNLLQLLRLHNRLYWLKREVRQLQDSLNEKR